MGVREHFDCCPGVDPAAGIASITDVKYPGSASLAKVNLSGCVSALNGFELGAFSSAGQALVVSQGLRTNVA
jgi:hypothetical protein